ncbi:hypothetical protein CJ184_004165 [Actinotignum urinale]|uniref:hypothetical protein n=1 Tax=Actinotignum urinale TaxID=190146 RepID=UPI002543753A|nr:hypothetical protein [Actinotignum urinale]WIK58471.1 hypothetical protein CJ184_004165 [Actinotignum urinale]
MFNLKDMFGSFATHAGRALLKPARILRKLLIVTLACALGFALSSPSLAQAENLQISSQAGDGLEIGPEIIGQPVRGAIPAPTIDPVYYDATTISGGKVQRKRIPGVGIVRSTVYVTLKDKNGNVKFTGSVTPRSGTTWTVDLPATVKVAEGDTVTAYQTLDGDTSSVVPANAEPSKAFANKDKIKMPVGEIWIEQPDANIVSDDEQAEAIEMLKSANPDIVNDFDLAKTKFSINTADHAYYEVTYTDGSTSGKIEATDLKIKTVKEKSTGLTIQKVQVTDGEIIVTLDKEVVAGTKFYFVKYFTDGEERTFGENGSCKVDKSNPQEMSQAVTKDGKKVTFPIEDKVKDLELGREFGIVVKEPHKFRSCAKSEPVVATPDKVYVRDPHKLTDADKKAIDKAIRDANTVNGVSKLPDGNPGTDWEGIPAVIQFDDSGNVKIFSASDAEVTYDSNWNPVPVKNPDGSVKVKEGAQPVITFPAKDLVKNIAPKSPAIAVDTNTGKVTITPPAYKDSGDDTDLLSYTVTYKDASGAEKTVTATRDLQSNKWSGPGVNEESGVITLSVEDIELAGTITATAKDNGGLEGDTDKLVSDPATKKLETATVSYNGNGGTGNMDGKTLNKGSKYKISDNAFTAPDSTPEFKAWEIDGQEVAPGTEITVTKDTEVKALWKKVDQKLTLTVDPNEVTIVKGSPMLRPMNVEAHSTSVGGPITLQTICLPNNQSMPSGVALVGATQDAQPPTGYKARATARIDGNANQADVGTYSCWVYASLNGVTIDENGNATGSGTTQAKEGVNWVRMQVTIHVVEKFVLPKTGVFSLNYVAGYAALLIVALTGVGYLRQNRREKSTV